MKNQRRFLADAALHTRIQHLGLLNSLAQTLLKLAAPGVRPIRDGTVNFSLVDPDNRRPVDSKASSFA